MKASGLVYLTVVFVVIFSTGCDEGSNSSLATLQANEESIEIVGAGIKGPIAFADAKVFSIDPSSPDFYDKNSPISSAITDEYAQISKLKIPRRIKPPYILTIGGTQAIDLNTGKPPVIPTLITVITKDMLSDHRPIYATPLTTLAFYMARHNSTADTDAETFGQNMISAGTEVIRIFGVDISRPIDIFNSPVVFDKTTDTLDKQEEAVYHRAAIEGFAAKVHLASLSGTGEMNTAYANGNIIELLALDIQSDSIINNVSNDIVIGTIDPALFYQNPMYLTIPNTDFKVSDTITLMENERILIATNNGPELLVDTTILETLAESYNDHVLIMSTNSIDFGFVDMGSMSDVFNISIYNASTGPFTISEITLSNGFYETNNCGNFLPEGTSCSIEISFVPLESGAKTGSLVIDGVPANAPYSVSLRGTSIVDEQTTIIREPSFTEAIFHTDFNNEELHTYTITDVNEDWDAYDAIVLNGGIAVVNDPDPNGNHGKALRAFYAEGEYGYNGGSGGQWIKSLDGYDELYFAFDIYFESDFDFVKTIKLPSPRSSDWLNNWFIGKPDGTDFWTAGITAESGGELTSYVYHAEQSGTYGDTINWDDGADGLKTYFTPGEWHTVEIRVKINTPGVLDGRLQGWFDGEKRLDTSNLMWRKPGGEGLKIGEYMFYTFFGGDDSSFAPIKDEHIYFDNFVISTQPITH